MPNNSKIPIVRLTALTGFSLNTAYAIADKWSLPEFCWSTWLAALFFSWACLIVGFIRIILDAQLQKKAFELRFTFLRNISYPVFLLILILAVICTAWFMYYLYCYLFLLYGLLLSAFAEMQPYAFFGKNGFINSNFFSPITYLVIKFWPAIIGLFLSNMDIFLKATPWQLMSLPLQSREIIKIHLMVVLTPFLCLLAVAFFKSQYQAVVIVVLLGVFHLTPALEKRRAAGGSNK